MLANVCQYPSKRNTYNFRSRRDFENLFCKLSNLEFSNLGSSFRSSERLILGIALFWKREDVHGRRFGIGFYLPRSYPVKAASEITNAKYTY